MRVAHVTATFPPYAGGTGNVAYHNAVEVAKLGYDTHVFTPWIGDAPAEECVQNILVHRLEPRLSYGNAHFVPDLYKQFDTFDLLHVHLPFYGGSEAIYLLRSSARPPLIVTYHHDVNLRGAAGQINRFHDRLIGDRLLQKSDRVCFTSLDYGRSSRVAHLIERGMIHALELPNGVDSGRFTQGRRPVYLANRYNLSGRRILLFVGALDRAHHFKGIPVLLEAMVHLRQADCYLLIAGDGDQLPVYRALAESLGVADHVIFSGYVAAEELPDHYRLADVTILPSTESGEAFGLVLIESLACETPVIASNLAGVRSVVSDGRDGLLVPPADARAVADAVERMLALPAAERQAMGRAGREKVVARYDWPVIGRQMESIYGDVLATASSDLLVNQSSKSGLAR